MNSERERYQQGEALDAGNRWIVLTDDAFVEDQFGLQRVVGHVVKHVDNPVLKDAGGLPVVLYDAEQECFHMWTQGHDREAWEHQFVLHDFQASEHFYPYFVRYARSADGVNWEMPELGLVEDPEGRWRNIAVTGDWRAQSHWVWFNPDASDRKRRFLMTYKDRPGGNPSTLMLASSPDGIHFQTEREVLWHCSDGSHQPVYDEERDRWLLYTRPPNRALMATGHYAGFNIKRRVAVHVGRTPWEWGYGRGCVFPEEECDVRDIDFVTVFRHGTHFVGLLTMMDMERQGSNEVHIATSRDGLSWSRFPHRPLFLPRGEDEAFDAGQAHGPVLAGVFEGEATFYYMGTPDGQKVPNGRPGGIGIARVREGRFVGMHGDGRGGYLLTRELKVTGSRLEVNFEPADKTGFLRVRLLKRDASARHDKAAAVLEGYGFTDCDAIDRDVTGETVRWKECGDLSALERRVVAFTDMSEGDIARWTWRFSESVNFKSDGTMSHEQHPIHVFDSPGGKTVRLTVEGPAGTDSFVIPYEELFLK